MAIFYVRSGATGTNAGTSWTNAYTAFGSAVTAATVNGDLIYVAHDHAEDLAADTTYTFAANVRVICVNTGTGAATTGARIGHTSSNRSITLTGGVVVYIYGIRWQIAGTLVESINIGAADGGHFELESCELYITNTNNGARIQPGINNASGNSFTKFKNCLFRFGGSGQQLLPHQTVIIEGGSVDAAGTAPSALIDSNGTAGLFRAYGWDISHITGTLVEDSTGQTIIAEFYNCKLGSGVVPLETQTSPANKGAGSITLVDCAAGDQHYHLAHYDPFGSTVVDTGIYANDGAQYDGTNRYSMKISTTANCSYWTPYVSPWFTKYHSGTSSITPYLEILRDGSTTAYQDDEVWAEFTAKTTSGSPISTFYSDRMTLLGTPANQAAGVGTSGWTGEAGSAWSGKCDSGSAFTPAEIGDIMARLVVGEPSITVYVDPNIRGL